MAKRVVTQKEAAKILGAWGERRLAPLCTPSSEELDFSLDDTCSEMLRAIANDPEGDLSVFPKPLLLMAWARVLWGHAAALLAPAVPVITLEPHVSKALLLQVLIGGLLAESRVPRAEAEALSAAASQQSPPGSHRLH